MLLELAKPLSLLMSILSLQCVFYAAFLMPAANLEQRIWLSLELLSLSAGICVVTGLLFREPLPEPDDELELQWRAWRSWWSKREGWDEESHPAEPLLETLPVRLFCWATAVMSALFVLAWYVETYCLVYLDVHRAKL